MPKVAVQLSGGNYSREPRTCILFCGWCYRDCGGLPPFLVSASAAGRSRATHGPPAWEWYSFSKTLAVLLFYRIAKNRCRAQHRIKRIGSDEERSTISKCQSNHPHPYCKNSAQKCKNTKSAKAQSTHIATHTQSINNANSATTHNYHHHSSNYGGGPQTPTLQQKCSTGSLRTAVEHSIELKGLVRGAQFRSASQTTHTHIFKPPTPTFKKKTLGTYEGPNHFHLRGLG